MSTQAAEPHDVEIRTSLDKLGQDTSQLVRSAGHLTIETLKNPTAIAALAGAAAMGAVLTIGVVQTAIGGTAAYVAYRVLKRRKAHHET